MATVASKLPENHFPSSFDIFYKQRVQAEPFDPSWRKKYRWNHFELIFLRFYSQNLP